MQVGWEMVEGNELLFLFEYLINMLYVWMFLQYGENTLENISYIRFACLIMQHILNKPEYQITT